MLPWREKPRFTIGATLVLLCGLFLPADVSAHLGSTKLVWIDASPEGAEVRVDLDPIDIAYELELDDPDQAEADGLLPHDEGIRSWAERVFSLRSDGGACTASATRVGAVDVEGSLRMTRAVRVELSFVCPEPRSSMVFRDDSVFDSDAQHEAIVRVGDSPTVLRIGRQEVVLGETASVAAVLGTFLVEGAIHLATGYDHILFLLALLLVAGEVASRDGTKKAIRDVALMVTAFTVGHSVTLIAAALDVVVLPSRFVESAIAASIVAVAIWNVTRPEARVGLRWVAGVFGLIHGFGFSSVLRELILPTGERVTALLAFNVGIELAQLVIVAAVVPILAWAGSRGWYRNVVVRGGSGLIGAVALFWFVQRAFDL